MEFKGSNIGCYLQPGLTNAADFPEIRRIQGDTNLKFIDFTVHKFEFFQNIKNKKICKKLDEILRSLVKKFFEINNVCMVKI
jgi:hypothetical protein